MLVLPFRVGALELVHTLGDDALDRQARDFWRDISDKALFQYRSQNSTDWCKDREDFPGGGQSLTIVFAVFDVDRRGNRAGFVGTWALYKVSRAVDRSPGVVTALVAPMLPEILDEGAPLTRLATVNDYFLDNDLITDDPRVPIRLVKRRKSNDADAVGPQAKRDQGSWEAGRGLRVVPGRGLNEIAKEEGDNTTRTIEQP